MSDPSGQIPIFLQQKLYQSVWSATGTILSDISLVKTEADTRYL